MHTGLHRFKSPDEQEQGCVCFPVVRAQFTANKKPKQQAAVNRTSTALATKAWAVYPLCLRFVTPLGGVFCGLGNPPAEDNRNQSPKLFLLAVKD